jgi:hypothetical protein
VQLGYRTQIDAIAAEKREVTEPRFTSLDRILARKETEVPMFQPATGYFLIELGIQSQSASEATRVRSHHLHSRLLHLQTMGLARSREDEIWELRRDFAVVLKAMQRTQDRQRLLHQHGALLSNPRLPMVFTQIRKAPLLEGRVLVHGEEETGRMYLLLEGTDAKIHYINHTPEVAAAWGKGKLKPNTFIRFRRMFANDGRPLVEVTDLGDADRLLKNKRLLSDVARGVRIPVSEQWGGWLGKYGEAVKATVGDPREHSQDPGHKTQSLGR